MLVLLPLILSKSTLLGLFGEVVAVVLERSVVNDMVVDQGV